MNNINFAKVDRGGGVRGRKGGELKSYQQKFKKQMCCFLAFPPCHNKRNTGNSAVNTLNKTTSTITQAQCT